MSSFTHLIARGDADSESHNSTMAMVLIIVLAILIVAVLAVGGFFFVRYRRNSKKGDLLPVYEEKRPSSSSSSNHRRLTVRPTQSIYVYQEKQSLLQNSDAPPSPSSPVPEIRITFPEEVDGTGKRQSGRVVVVHVGDKSLGMEPYKETLPPYQQNEGDRFQSLDLDRIGGLKEKEVEVRWT